MLDGFLPYSEDGVWEGNGELNDWEVGIAEASWDEDRLNGLYDIYRDCTLCPRSCHADRTNGQVGYCGASDEVKVARAALHYWEEPPISGDNGSGTVFFAHCQLQCVYCQNAKISRAKIDPIENPWISKSVDAAQLARMFLNLEAEGANNINLVSATQYLPTVINAIVLARKEGLRVPIVYNTGGYEKVETLRLLSGFVDVYLTDVKHWDPASGARYAKAANYPKVALSALSEMVSQTGAPKYISYSTGEEIMESGTIVRHLLLPGALDEAERILDYLGTEYGDRIVVSLMSQYVPMVDAKKYPEIAMRIDPVDYDNLVDYSCNFDFDECFMQESDSAETEYIPDFGGEGLIGSESKTLW